MSELPRGWATCFLPDVAEIVMGQSPPSDTYNKEGRGLPFFQGKAEFGHLYPTTRKYCDTPGKIAETGDILISVRAPVGPTNLCREKSCIGRGLAAIRHNEATSEKFLLSFFRHIEPWLSMQGTGSTFTAISRSDLNSLQVPLPPLNEQRRIVAKLEELLARVEASEQRLAKIPVILKRFRQAVLAAACSGRLTADWREENLPSPGAPRHPLPEGTEGEGRGEGEELPEGWVMTKVDRLGSFITSGSRGWAQYYADSGSIFIRAQNINSDFLDLSEVAYVNLPSRAEGLRTKVQVDDLLVTITGANVTKSARVNVHLDDAYVSQHVALVRLKDLQLSKFLFLVLVSPAHGRAQLLDAAYGQGKPGLNLENIRDVNVPLPPLAEQQEIVRRIEALFILADQIEARYHKAKRHVDRLTQAILAKVFRGELVPQDASDEPALLLLERIRAERAMTSPPRRTKATPPRPIRTTYAAEPEPEPLLQAAEPDPVYAEATISPRLLATMAPGREYSRADLAGPLNLTTALWNQAIRELKEQGLVRQQGEKRGARYVRTS